MNTQTIIDKIKNDKILNNLASFFDNNIYLVGGAVRDFFLGKDTLDRDLIVTDEDAGAFSRRVSDFFGGVFIPLDEENKIYRVVLPDKQNYLDITNPIGGSLEADIARRDLTMNAIAVDIRNGDIIDYTGGVSDIENKIIKGVKEKNFIDDPLRLLRIFRFYSILGFQIDDTLLNIAQANSNLVLKSARERIEYELMKLFSGSFVPSALYKMDECSILDIIFPFVRELKQVPKNAHHHLNLFDHSIETIRQLDCLYNASSEFVKSHMENVDFGGFSRLAHLRLACFMHDIGKFSAWTIEEDTGRHRFIKHEDIGAKMSEKFLKSMCFSNKQISYISSIVKNHMYPSAVVSSPELSEKVMMRYIRKSGDSVIDNILIAQADRLSARGPEVTDEMVKDNIDGLNKLLNFYLNIKDTLKPLPKLLDGNDVMQILNIKPSKQLGYIMNALQEAQISGDVTTKDEAVLFVKTIL